MITDNTHVAGELDILDTKKGPRVPFFFPKKNAPTHHERGHTKP